MTATPPVATGSPAVVRWPARSSLERHFRDAQTLRHHGFMSDNRFETVGQVYCGVDPKFPMVAF
jgi:hypothetical protein